MRRATGQARTDPSTLQEPMDLGISSAMEKRKAKVSVEITAKGTVPIQSVNLQLSVR